MSSNSQFVQFSPFLDQHENPIILGLAPKLLPVFESVLGEPAEQLDIETRHKLTETVKFIHSKNPALISGSETLMRCVNGQ